MLDRRSFLAATAGGALLNYSSIAHAQSPTGAIVMAKVIDDMTSLDPHESFEYSGNEVCGNVYQKLVNTPNSDPGRLMGELAESWEVSPDAKTFTFKMRQGAKFSSGAAVTAEDAAFSLQRAVILNKSPAFIINQFGFTKDNVARLIRASDPATLVITLEAPTSPSFFLYCLSANVGSVVEKAVALQRQQGEDLGNAWMKQNSAGSGAYRLVSWRASESVTLDANPHAATPPRTRRFLIRHIADPSAQFLGLQQGDYDIARDLGSDQIRGLQGSTAFKLLTNRRASLMYLAMNQKNANLAKPQVRQAVKWAIDYAGIQTNLVPFTFAVHQTFLPEGFPSAVNDTPFHQDVARAKALLAEAGLPDGFEVTIDVQASQPYADIAQAVQANLAAVGIRARVLPGEQRAVITKTRARQHEMALLRWGADYFDPHTNAETFCMNPDNADGARNRTLAWRSSWQNEDLTARAVAAVKETDTAKRSEMYAALQRDHQAQSPFAIMLQEIEVVAMRANLTGFDLGPMSDRGNYRNTAKG
ncbi:peptide/nickel transport system substrate-binding protein [Humitalea rosea]|uniref:Peptide/nickel transport system substrate-binding protein n=1 Tax=Humitalea rosea TaxID=990373 RepID=A0A2W7IIM5_9PROT|nr:ABC transporter substrate-binding protein [Humitalea rosea]PZW45029.1 peptide/nickel transport system substrate-binding protein [Humitalea rosea]